MTNIVVQSSSSGIMDYCEIVLAIIAIIISVISLISTYHQNRKVLSITLKSDYYKRIFDAHLLSDIPIARDYIRFNDSGQIRDFDLLVDEIVRVWKDAAYFKYSDSIFYTELKKRCNSIEDYLFETGNKTLDMDEQAAFQMTLKDRIDALYEYITKYEFGV